MAVFFLDSSALIKRYLSETGSAWVESLFDAGAGNTVFIAAVTGVEIIAAITRRARGGTIPAPDATAACAEFRSDLNALPALTLVSADTELNAAAIGEGLVVEDPNLHP